MKGSAALTLGLVVIVALVIISSLLIPGLVGLVKVGFIAVVVALVALAGALLSVSLRNSRR